MHYGDANKTGKDETYMGYSETNSWTLPADEIPAHVAGDKIMFNVMAYQEAGTGADDVAKAEYLNENGAGSDWSRGSSVTF